VGVAGALSDVVINYARSQYVKVPTVLEGNGGVAGALSDVVINYARSQYVKVPTVLAVCGAGVAAGRTKKRS